MESSHISSQRVRMEIQSRFNPLKGFTPAKLSTALQEFFTGYIANAARIWDRIAEADDQCGSVIPKRERAVSLLNWEVIKVDDSPEAEKHKEALEFFYNNLTVTHALDKDLCAGMSMLLSQMMDAAGKKYAVHELEFEPLQDPVSGKWLLTGWFNAVPLWFFENTTGKLRFLRNQYDFEGEELDEDWMITCFKRPLMYATSIAYVYKNFALKDWSVFSEKFGMPWVHGRTGADHGSKEWNQFADDVAGLYNDSAIITSMAGEIDTINPVGTGDSPHEKLVDRMDRAIAILWRGGDLSTISSGNDAVGASLQSEEVEDIETDDATLLTETLNKNVDRRVLKLLFGVERGKAYLKIQPKARLDTDKEIKTDTFLIKHGVPLALQDLAERYGRTIAEDAEEIAEDKYAKAALEAQQETGAPGAGDKQQQPVKTPGTPTRMVDRETELETRFNAAESRLQGTARQLAAAKAGVRYLVNRALLDIAELDNDAARRQALVELRDRIPGFFAEMQQQDFSPALLEQIYATQFFNGLLEAREGLDPAET